MGKKPLSKKKIKQLAKTEDRRASSLAAFNNFYQGQWGDRWPSLYSALQAPTRHACLLNRHASPSAVQESVQLLPEGSKKVSYLRLAALESPNSERFPPPPRDPDGLCTYYLMDAASILATEALELEEGDRVLDLCAAPGGKSLCMLQHDVFSLTSNEPSPDRRRRLRQVIESYLPAAEENRVQVTGKDGTNWGESEMYDKALVDAPCSSERHLLHDEEQLSEWTSKRTVNNAKRQRVLLTQALKAVRVGGIVVYATCSISDAENDAVVLKVLKKRKIRVEVLRKQWPIGEETKVGWIVLPDQKEPGGEGSHGWGPLYFAVMRKLESQGEYKEEDEDEDGDEGS
ncbi:uncharacterized protein VTP21DRAFT_5268 [Calcarisporiella thermophila]|uniref:uncharacterized protein n=1 Tax=Calcarisporiella thermophila TaxID=911321 RepID=UPI0037424159